MSRSYYIFAPVILLCLFFNFLVFKNYTLQYPIIGEFNQNQRSETVLNKLLQSDNFIPNITITALPLNVLKADYLHSFGRNSEALELLNTKTNDNPYLMYNEIVKSKIFTSLKILDSAKFYSDIAFTTLPNNTEAFKDLAIVYGVNKDIEGLFDMFLLSRHNSNLNFWKIFLSTCLATDVNLDDKITDYIDQNYFKVDDEEVHGLMDNVLFGKENIDISQSLILEAQQYFKDEDYANAALNFEKSLEYNPNQYSSYENAALAYLNLKKYDKGIVFYERLIDKFPKISAKSKYYYAFFLSETGDTKKACQYLSQSIKENYSPSFLLHKNICK